MGGGWGVERGTSLCAGEAGVERPGDGGGRCIYRSCMNWKGILGILNCAWDWNYTMTVISLQEHYIELQYLGTPHRTTSISMPRSTLFETFSLRFISMRVLEPHLSTRVVTY